MSLHKSNKERDIVLDKAIFSNIFEEDIRRVYIYKKSERLAKALHLIAPAFTRSVSLKTRLDGIALGLIDSALEQGAASRSRLAHELLALVSVLDMAKVGGLLSPMNADIIVTEAELLLHEALSYEEPRLSLDETPSLSALAKRTQGYRKEKPQTKQKESRKESRAVVRRTSDTPAEIPQQKTEVKDRRQQILSIIKDKNEVRIKDISTLIRGVSEKTIQRELQALISEGTVEKTGERRWSVYSLR